MDIGFTYIDTSVIDMAVGKKEHLVSEFDAIREAYDRIVTDLLKEWKGKGANAFRDDAREVMENIGGIYDILKRMCDTLEDCKALLEEFDGKLGEFNADPGESK